MTEAPQWLQRAFRRAAEHAATRESTPLPRATATPPIAEPPLPVLQDPIEGRPKRGRLPDPDDKGQRAEPPRAWLDGGFGGLPNQW